MSDFPPIHRATRQSPIYVEKEFEADVAKDYLTFNWPANVVAHPRTPTDPGHSATKFSILAGPSSSGSIVLHGHVYILRELHFHAPSEHIVHGQQCEGELHLVHQSPIDARHAVVSVLICGSAKGVDKSPVDRVKMIKQFVARALDAAKAGEPPIDFTPLGLLPESREFFRYQGSLTTAPFGETVSWIVMSQPIAYDDSDLATLANRVDDHARAIQDRDRRIVVRCRPLP